MWFWPNQDEMNDFPDPVAFEAEWHGWPAELADGPSVAAEIFSREYIQNAWDGIKRQRNELNRAGRIDLLPERAEIQFRFVRLRGKELSEFLESSGVGSLRERFRSFSEKDRAETRLSLSDYLNSEEDPEELTLLVCSEVGGLGMFGHWYTHGLESRKGSHMKYALVTSRSEKGDTDATGVSGGSWGHGKKAIAGGSKCRVLLVNSAFVPRSNRDEDDPGVSRRFMGVAYWKAHSVAGKSYAGLGLLGKTAAPADPKWMEFSPHENEEADLLVKNISCPGFVVRDPSARGQSGTSYLVVEPVFGPEELAASIKRNWWPMVLSKNDEIVISVIDETGSEVSIEPSSDESLIPFIRCFEIARGNLPPTNNADLLVEQSSLRFKHDGKEKMHGAVVSGALALTSDRRVDGWSLRNDGKNINIVCLIRGEMVIAYQRSPRLKNTAPPFVRGTFYVDPTPGVNDVSARILRLTEPHLHDKWGTTANNAVAAADATFANKVMNAIHISVREFVKSLREDREVHAKNFPEFNQFFRMKRKGEKSNPKPKPKPGPSTSRFFSIRQLELKRHVDPLDTTQLVAEATFEIDLRPTTARLNVPDTMEVSIVLGWRTLEDGRPKDAPELSDHDKDVFPPDFELKDGVLTGTITRGAPVVFSWKSRSYSGDWTIAPDPDVSPADRIAEKEVDAP